MEDINSWSVFPWLWFSKHCCMYDFIWFSDIPEKMKI